MKRSQYNLAQWLEWMENNHPTEIDLGLARVGQVYRQMQIDLTASKIISVAGTNGKGSTTALLEAIYLAAGYTTLAYTSPHMLRYNERVRINASDVTDLLLIEAFNAIDLAMGEGASRISLSYFEIGTLAAFYLISRQQPNIAILEVGLGGRLDAVNVVDADIAVITTLAIDHIDWLGDDIEQIGREKAGIARSGRPLICGELNPPSSIQQLAADQGIPLSQINQQFSYHQESSADDHSWSWQGLDINNKALRYTGLALPCLPVQNAATALQVIAKLDQRCSLSAINSGLQNASAIGRLQTASYLGSQLILDVAHNPQSAQHLAKMLKNRDLTDKVHLVLGVLIDKDCQGLIAALADVCLHWHLVTLDVPRGQTAEQLQKTVLNQGIEKTNTSCYTNIELALAGAIQAATDSQEAAQQVVVAGSFVTVGQALELLEK